MKIAFVANTSWNIYNFRKGLVQHFISKGDQVLVLTPKDEYTESIIGWGAKWIETPLDGTGINPIKDLGYFLKLRRAFAREKPDVVLGYTIKSNIYSCLASSKKSTPVICNVSGLGTAFLVKGFVARIAMTLYKLAFKNADYVFFQNKDDRNLFVSQVPLPEEKIGLIPGSGINLQEFPYRKPEFKNTTKFLMISRLIVEKGVYEFAEAASFFAEDENISFTLVGKFDENHARSIKREDLDRWIQEGWLSYLPHSDKIKNMIEEHEVIVLPSYREGTPRTLLEGAAIGRTLLAADVPGCKEVIKDSENGFLFDVKDAKSLVAKIKLYLQLNNEEKLNFSFASRKLVEDKFDENLIVKSYEEVIHRIKTLA